MLRPLVPYEAPWSRGMLRQLCRSNHRWIQRAPAAHYSLPPVAAQQIGGQSTRTITFQNRQAQATHEPAPLRQIDTSPRQGGSNIQLIPPVPSASVDALRDALLAALQSNDPEQLLTIAFGAFQSRELVASLPPTTIAQVFESLRFDNLIASHWATAQVLAPGAIRVAQAAGWKVRNIRQVIEQLRNEFSMLFTTWVDHGHPVDLLKCKSYLRFLSAAGLAKEARKLRQYCATHGIQWDTETYNLFLKALCWEDAYHPDQFGKLRVTDATLRDRQAQGSEQTSIGYTTAIKAEAMEAFEEMMSRGYAADVQTFSLLILSMGRVGDLEGVEATLSRIWGVDVSSLINEDSSNIYFENDMQPDSPLFPDEHLLFVVAHIFGSNNSLSKALKVVDFLAQKYSLTIDSHTWEELAKWAHVLGRRRGSGSVELSEQKAYLQGVLAAGKVPQALFRSLWRTMTSSYFQHRPSLNMFNWMYVAHYRRGEFLEMVALLRRAQRIFGLAESPVNLTRKTAPSQYSTELERLKALSRSAILRRWVRLVLHTNNLEWRGKDKHSLRWLYGSFLPNFIAEWGNLWYSNTVQALHHRTLYGHRLSFHRQMQEENLMTVEVFPAAQQGRYIVRPKLPSFSLPFQEITYAERRKNRIDREVSYGRFVEYKAPIQWYERRAVRDWIWFAPMIGIRIQGGRFEGSRFGEPNNERRFVVHRYTLDRLEPELGMEVRRRIASQ